MEVVWDAFANGRFANFIFARFGHREYRFLLFVPVGTLESSDSNTDWSFINRKFCTRMDCGYFLQYAWDARLCMCLYRDGKAAYF